MGRSAFPLPPAPPKRDATPDDVEVYRHRLAVYERERDAARKRINAAARLFVLKFALAMSLGLNAGFVYRWFLGAP
jgi:hypothetical protein